MTSAKHDPFALALLLNEATRTATPLTYDPPQHRSVTSEAFTTEVTAHAAENRSFDAREISGVLAGQVDKRQCSVGFTVALRVAGPESEEDEESFSELSETTNTLALSEKRPAGPRSSRP
jgi:hypothetical protein